MGAHFLLLQRIGDLNRANLKSWINAEQEKRLKSCATAELNLYRYIHRVKKYKL